MKVVRILAVLALLVAISALGVMVFPLVIVGALALLAYGVGKASRHGWR